MNLPSKLLLSVALSILIAPSYQTIPIDPTSTNEQFGGLQVHKPGVKLRMTQAVSDMVK